jgi:hypothetical protein
MVADLTRTLKAQEIRLPEHGQVPVSGLPGNYKLLLDIGRIDGTHGQSLTKNPGETFSRSFGCCLAYSLIDHLTQGAAIGTTHGATCSREPCTAGIAALFLRVTSEFM